MAIKIKGVIGSDVVGSEFSDRISKLTGDIEFEIDSPGGSVFHGISIYNAIKNYNRGKCTMHVVGDCSSMAAYIMLAGDGPVLFEPNSIVVLHNPWSFASGDYRRMQKEASVLEQLSALYAKAFVERELFEEKEIRQIMDNETWFIGAEKLKKLGKVLCTSNNASDDGMISEEIKIAACRERIEDAKAVIKSLKEENIEKIAALIPNIDLKQANKIEKIYNPIISKQQKGENKMFKTIDEFKAQCPEIYNGVKDDGKNIGIQEEKTRVNSLIPFLDIDKEATITAIINGKTIADQEFQSAILMAKVKSQEIQTMQQENPPSIDPKAETHAPESPKEELNAEIEQKQKEKEEKTVNNILARLGLK